MVLLNGGGGFRSLGPNETNESGFVGATEHFVSRERFRGDV